jgi:hypothetical protein
MEDLTDELLNDLSPEQIAAIVDQLEDLDPENELQPAGTVK